MAELTVVSPSHLRCRDSSEQSAALSQTNAATGATKHSISGYICKTDKLYNAKPSVKLNYDLQTVLMRQTQNQNMKTFRVAFSFSQYKLS